MRFRTRRQIRSIFSLAALGLSLAAVVTITANIDTVQYALIRATGSPANLIVDTKGVISPLNRSWQYLAQGGEEDNYRLQPIANHIRQLDPYHIRLDHIYTYYVHISRDQNGGLVYDWTKLDNILGDMRAVGVRSEEHTV